VRPFSLDVTFTGLVALVSVVRQLLTWQTRVPVLVGLLVGQSLLVQSLLVQVVFATRW
jgi:hypothetical protein